MTTLNPIRWSSELALAVARIANDRAPKPHREELASDVRSRAREFIGVRVGHELAPHQVDYVKCLRSRLGDSHAIFDGEVEFQAAWGDAYQLANQPTPEPETLLSATINDATQSATVYVHDEKGERPIATIQRRRVYSKEPAWRAYTLDGTLVRTWYQHHDGDYLLRSLAMTLKRMGKVS